ncbi:hypothetical protein Lal_00015141 [Lupinus albus]|nr:hypothetical protein Lal_00015141 [Lupinus albus]
MKDPKVGDGSEGTSKVNKNPTRHSPRIWVLTLLLTTYAFCYHFKFDDSFEIDGLSIGPILLTEFINTLATVVAHSVTRESGLFHFLIGQIGTFSQRDILLFFIMWEIELIPIYLLLTMWWGMGAKRSIFLMGIIGISLYSSNEPTLNLEMTRNNILYWISYCFFCQITYYTLPYMVTRHPWKSTLYHLYAFSRNLIKNGSVWIWNYYPHAHSIFSPWLMIIGSIQIIYATSTSLGDHRFYSNNLCNFNISGST